MDAIEKMRRFVCNVYHAGMGPLDTLPPYPDLGQIVVGDAREVVELVYAMRGQAVPDWYPWEPAHKERG